MTDFIASGQVAEEDLFPGMAELLEDILTPHIEVVKDPLNSEQYLGMYIETLTLDLPIEIQTLRNEANELELGVAPPTQWIETTVQPVLHRVRVTLELDDGESRDQALES